MIPSINDWNGKTPFLSYNNPYDYLSDTPDPVLAIQWEIAECQKSIAILYRVSPVAVKLNRLLIYIWTLALHDKRPLWTGTNLKG
jgi:hypothetical protein